MVKLSDKHKEKLSQYLNQYRDRLEKELYGGEWDKERKARTEYYHLVFGEEHLDKLTEAEFGNAIEQLWASRIWGKADYLITKIVTDNGLDKIRMSLKLMLHGEEPLEERFDLFSGSI